MRKITAILLALILCLTLTACNGGSGSDAGNGGGGGTPDVTADITGEITISCYETMTYKSFLDDAAQKFEEKYPGAKVNVETFSAMPEIQTMDGGDGQRAARISIQDDPQGRADYVNKVGTNLMSGSGADIYAIDVLPAYKYAESKQLEDLTSYMDSDPDFNRADYKSNVIDAVKYKGGIWFMPMDYTFDYYTYDSTLISDSAADWGVGSKFSTQDLLDLGKAPFDAGSEAANLFSMYDYSPRGDCLFTALLADNYSNYVDFANKKANFNDGAFVNLMESVKQYAADGYVPEGVTAMQPQMGGPGGAGDYVIGGSTGANRAAGGGPPVATDRFFFKLKNQMNLQSYYNQGAGLRMNFAFGGSALGIEDDDKIAGVQADANGNVPFTYSQAYGINADSKNKATAWAFIKFLLSYDEQVNMSGMGTLALNNAARARRIELQIGGAFTGGSGMMMFRAEDGGGPDGRTGPDGQGRQIPETPDPDTLVLTEEQRAIYDQYMAAVEAMGSQINSYVFTDTIIDDLLSEQTQSFFDGSKSAAEVASALQNKADLYINE